MCAVDRRLTLERIDRLLAYLPLFEGPGDERTVHWNVGAEGDPGCIVMPYPTYPDAVIAFFEEAGKPWWSDYQYKPREAGRMLADEERIAQADLEHLKTMLTYCVRGERFCDGHWEAMIDQGRILSLLQRLAVLRDSRT